MKNTLFPLVLLSAACAAQAQLPPPEFASIGRGVVGALYKPAENSEKAKTGVMVMHAEDDYTQFSACRELAERGYTVLCANNSFSKDAPTSGVEFKKFVLDADKAVKYLKNRPEIEKVVLLGHSGGGAMLSAYQNVAENGRKACNASEKILPCTDDKEFDQLTKADGIILLDANYGLSTMTLLSLNPAITDETDPKRQDPSLNLFDVKNGFSETGANYTADFAKHYQQGQSLRMNKIIAQAQQRYADVLAGKGNYTDDEPLIIADAQYFGFNNRLFSQDPRFLSRTEQPHLLLKADGKTATQIIRTVRTPKNLRVKNGQFKTGAMKTSLKRFLNTFAIRTDSQTFGYNESGFTGVDWDSTHTSPISAVKGISVPLLTLGMTANWEYLAAEKIYQNAKSQDKTVAFVEGASHIVTPCKECEKTAGEFGDTVKTTYDFIADWLGKRF